MRVADWGRFEGEVLVFGGPLSNLAATRAVLSEGRRRGAAMVCTGDVVGYCADGPGCVAALRAAGVRVIAGNVERQLAAGAGDCGCGFEAGTTCDLLSAGWYGHANATIDATDRGWMAELPDLAVFAHAGLRVAVIHGGASDVSRFVWEVSAEEIFAEEIARIVALVGGVDVVMAGHSGLPFVRNLAGVTWVNAGVVGMPPHDGGQATRYALLRGGHAKIQRLGYDAGDSFARMQEAGLTQGYDRALKDGWWPSEDVLPDVLRRHAVVGS